MLKVLATQIDIKKLNNCCKNTTVLIIEITFRKCAVLCKLTPVKISSIKKFAAVKTGENRHRPQYTQPSIAIPSFDLYKFKYFKFFLFSLLSTVFYFSQ